MSNARDKANIPSLNFSSTGIDDNATSTAITINSNETVGIGTSSPSQLLHVYSTANQIARFETSITEGHLSLKDLTGEAVLKFRNDYRFTNSTGELVRINSSGNVGIGTSSPSASYGKLTVAGGMTIADDNFAKLQIGRYSAGVANSYIKMGANSNSLRFTNPADTADLMTIYSSGNVGIGTSSPDATLHIEATNASMLLSNSGRSQYFRIQNNETDDALVFNANDTSERMRIDSSGNLKFNSGYGSVATAYGCRAWVNFDGQGTIAIRESGNVSSLTDLGTGFYQINFTTAMPDVNYAVSGMSRGYNDGASNPSNFTTTSIDRDTNSLSTGFVKICSGRTGASGSTSSEFLDMETQTVAVFR